MWLKAIIELEKIDKYKTPSLKMKQLSNFYYIFNIAFNLTSTKEGQVAVTDDVLTFFPYLIVMAKISRLK